MNTHITRTFIVLTCLMAVNFSCHRDIFDLDLEEIEPQIVIEAIVTDQTEPNTVRIITTGDYDQQDNFSPVSGADVIITEHGGDPEILNEIEAGIYQTSKLRGRSGKTYSLQVVSGETEYHASSTMPVALKLDYVNLEIHRMEAFLTCAFTDHEGIEDFCRINVYRNGEQVERYLYYDRFKEGQQVLLDDFHTTFLLGDKVDIELLTINSEIYDYYSMLYADEEEGITKLPDFVPVTLYNPKTNLSNNALGYFSAHTISKYSLIVE